MSNHKRGQSIIEYSLILTLVILGVAVMGPYILRSINAHFKIWDDEIQDSHNERLTPLNVPPAAVGIPSGSLGPGSDGTDGRGEFDR